MPPVINDSEDASDSDIKEQYTDEEEQPKGEESDLSSDLSDAEEDVDIDEFGDDDGDVDKDDEGDDEGDVSSELENAEITVHQDDEGEFEEELPLSDTEDFKIEDPDEIDEDLESRDEEEEPKPSSKKLTIKASARRAAPAVRESRKRQLTYYEEDDDDEGNDDEEEEEEEEEDVGRPQKTRKIPERRVQPQDLDADLILTDEEQEYNPHANPDVSKMTERQRARFMEEENSKNLFALGESIKEVKKKRPKQKETEEETQLRKAESTRRRQDYKNKQDEEEKRDTLNKLLKRRATKTRATVGEEKEGPVDVKSLLKPRRPVLQHPALNRYVTNTTDLNGNATLSINN